MGATSCLQTIRQFHGTTKYTGFNGFPLENADCWETTAGAGDDTPPKINMESENDDLVQFKRNVLFQGSIFRFHVGFVVGFGRCIFSNLLDERAWSPMSIHNKSGWNDLLPS